MPERQQQADRVTAALGDWLSKVQTFDAAHAADVAAMATSNAAARAANDVKWKLSGDARGVARKEIIEAEQLAQAADDAKAAYDAAFQTTAAASTARNDARATLRGAVDALDQDGSAENMSGTAL